MSCAVARLLSHPELYFHDVQVPENETRFMSYIIFIFIIIVFHICVDYCKGVRPTCCHEASDLAKNSALIATAPNNIGYRIRILLYMYITC